ncbi:MAG: hypothetical protein EP317_01770 [Bacillota bacterium]|nr:MAG: hypothetical protein EP317_01770 [Bacillota bacterium]
MKKIFLLVLMIFSVFALVACKDEIDPTINPPTNVEISDEGLLTWNAVSGADYYIVYIDQRPIEVREGTSLDLTTQNILVGNRLVSVVTVKGESQSLPSTVLTYTVVQLSDPEVVTEGVLAILNPAYTSADMTRSDFANDWDFEEYQNMLRMTEAYAEAVTSINMSEANALGFFDELNDMMGAEQGPENLSALMTEMEMLDTYDIDAYAAATIIYHLLIVSLEMEVERSTAQEVYEVEDGMDVEEMLAALQANPTITIQSLEIIIDFLLTFKDSLSTNVIGLLDDAIEGTELSINEIIIIKDEVVGILQDTMPSVTDFTFLYSSLMTIAGAISGEDMSGYLPHAQFLAEVNHLEITIVLEFIASVDTQTVEDIQAMVESIETSMEPNPEALIDLVLYVMTYISDFKDANATLFADFDELMQDEAMEALFGLAIDQVIYQIENDPYMDENEAAMAVGMLEAFKAEYDTIRATMDIFATIGENVFNEFVSSEAALFYAILDLQMNSMELPMVDVITSVIEDILPLFMDYNTAIMGELDQEAILTILEFIQIPATAALGSMMMAGTPNFDAILDDVADVVANVILLETAVLNAIDDANIPAIMSNQNLDPEVAAILSMITVLDIALSSANELVIDDIINTIFENILKDAEMVALHGMTVTEINEMKTMVTTEVDGFITEIHAIADFNFNALTYDDMERIGAIAEMIQMIFEGMDGGNKGPEEYYYIVYGTSTVYVDGPTYFLFTPGTSGFYYIESLVSGDYPDTYISIFDEDMYEIGYDDDSGDSWNFAATVYLEAGRDYYLLINTYESGYHMFDVLIYN